MATSKYFARLQKIDGFTFDSQMEAARYEYWRLYLKAGEILHLDVHPVVTLPGAIRWTLDFCVWVRLENGRGLHCIYEDVKGFATPDFKMKRRLFDSHHPAAPLQVMAGRKARGKWIWWNFDELQEKKRARKARTKKLEERAT